MMADLTLAAFEDTGLIASRLGDAGLVPAAAKVKAGMFRKVARCMIDAGVSSDAKVSAFFVPGRVEVVGKHTDYGAGRTTVAAVDRGFCVISRTREDDQLRLIRADGEGEAAFSVAPSVMPRAGEWTNYPMTTVRRLARNFDSVRTGADVAFLSDLPRASGMSSSSAMVTATFLVVARANNLYDQKDYQQHLGQIEQLAGYLGAIENGSSFGELEGDRGVGTFGGSEDHTAIIASKPNMLSQFAYCPVRLERRLPLPPGYTLAIGFSGADAEKTGAARDQYNSASKLASDALKTWRMHTGKQDAYLAQAIANAAGGHDEVRQIIAQHAAPEVLERFDHFYAENEEVVPQAGDALEAQDVAKFGQVVDRSQLLTDTLLHNQVPQTIFLAKAAREHGAAAASAFGAGFGGSVWALVKNDEIPTFLQQWQDAYADAFPEEAARADFFQTHPGPAAFELV